MAKVSLNSRARVSVTQNGKKARLQRARSETCAKR
jgi:hypothetical protein